jgi:hypothetical protein
MSRIGTAFLPLAAVRRLAAALGHALRLYLCLALLGCASTRPGPTVTQSGDTESASTTITARDLESRVVPADERLLFQACVGTLQDLGYTIDLADTDAGILTTSRVSDRRLGEIGEPRLASADEGSTSAWSKVGQAVVVVSLFVIAIAAMRAAARPDGKATPGPQIAAQVSSEEAASGGVASTATTRR